MDWVMVVLILTEAPNFSQSHSHYLAGFASEKLCKTAAKEFEDTFNKPTEMGMKIDSRAVCSQRK